MTAEDIIRAEYQGSTSFMTPRVLLYGKLSRRMAYELSRGSGLIGEPIYGLSIVRLMPNDETTRCSELSTLDRDLGKLHTLIAALRRRFTRLDNIYRYKVKRVEQSARASAH